MAPLERMLQRLLRILDDGSDARARLELGGVERAYGTGARPKEVVADGPHEIEDRLDVLVGRDREDHRARRREGELGQTFGEKRERLRRMGAVDEDRGRALEELDASRKGEIPESLRDRGRIRRASLPREDLGVEIEGEREARAKGGPAGRRRATRPRHAA